METFLTWRYKHCIDQGQGHKEETSYFVTWTSLSFALTSLSYYTGQDNTLGQRYL